VMRKILSVHEEFPSSAHTLNHVDASPFQKPSANTTSSGTPPKPKFRPIPVTSDESDLCSELAACSLQFVNPGIGRRSSASTSSGMRRSSSTLSAASSAGSAPLPSIGAFAERGSSEFELAMELHLPLKLGKLFMLNYSKKDVSASTEKCLGCITNEGNTGVSQKDSRAAKFPNLRVDFQPIVSRNLFVPGLGVAEFNQIQVQNGSSGQGTNCAYAGVYAQTQVPFSLKHYEAALRVSFSSVPKSYAVLYRDPTTNEVKISLASDIKGEVGGGDRPPSSGGRKSAKNTR
jgi:hypothetical protein